MNLKIKKILIFSILISLIVACGTNKKLLTQLRNEADIAFSKGDYTTALLKYRQLKFETQPYDSAIYRSVAISAYKVGEYMTTCQYGVKVNTTNDEQLLVALAESFDSIGQMHETISLIEINAKIFEQHYGEQVIVEKLAKYYNYTKDAKLVDLYPRIESADVRSTCFETYFRQIKNTTDSENLKEICRNALKDNAQQIVALEYIAVDLYDIAEGKYKKAMNEYESNKNATTYAYLRRDLKRISPTFVEAKNNFEQLRKIKPDELKYVRYLVNIYNRLDNKAKVNELKKLL